MRRASKFPTVLERHAREEVPMEQSSSVERINTVVIGAGQAGLSTGYHLSRRKVPFVILDAGNRVGDVWRSRWDSLRLFTAARFSSLDGLAFPAHPHAFPTAKQMGDYLEMYARTFALPIRNGVRVDRVSRVRDRFLVCSGDRRFEADNVVVAMSNFQKPKVPAFATELDPDIVQLHSFHYRNPGQLTPGDALVVGAGNSGAEIALELSRTRRTWLAGRDTGHVPFDIDTPTGFHLMRIVLRGLFHRVFTVSTPIGRRMRPSALRGGGPLVRLKPKTLAAAGVERVPKVIGVKGGLPVLEDGRVLDVASIIWCTGFHPGFSWIDLPVFGHDGEPAHDRGMVASCPGLYFVGLHFLYAFSSVMIHGVGRDAARVADAITQRVQRAGAAEYSEVA